MANQRVNVVPCSTDNEPLTIHSDNMSQSRLCNRFENQAVSNKIALCRVGLTHRLCRSPCVSEQPGLNYSRIVQTTSGQIPQNNNETDDNVQAV